MAVCVAGRAEALKTGQALLQKKYMVIAHGGGQQDATFGEGKDTLDALYRLLEDDPHSALNAGQTASCSPIKGRSGLDQAVGHITRRISGSRWCPPMLSNLCRFFAAGLVYDPCGFASVCVFCLSFVVIRAEVMVSGFSLYGLSLILKKRPCQKVFFRVDYF